MTVAELYAAIDRERRKVIVGQDATFELLVVALLAGGHVLLEGVPGIAKTLMAKTLAATVSGEFKRVQFTPDLMPADIVGTNIFDLPTGRFALHVGPIFANIVLGDEINRAPAKTQSALLEAMEERRVTIDGVPHDLPRPFLVLATQNPIEYEGTYPLPESQLDRFLFKLLVSYPSTADETQLLRNYNAGFDPHDLARAGVLAVANPASLAAARQEAAAVRADEAHLAYITAIAEASRRAPDLLLGGSPRASVALLTAAKVYAALQGREYLVPDDIKSLVPPIYRHRIILKPEAEIEGLTADRAIERILGRVPVPR
ncbi:MAG TPA: MoxR family ATPase [Chloroflexia bacterium]|nr:MoxR family ATPase [Chloroflexia bacterium]